ncbi:MAG: MarR family transcriptional regulator [Bacillota bacterium]|nr:MarR family transcriptional regulator [Bacillota bacterium]
MEDPGFSQRVAAIEELLRLVARAVRLHGREILSQFDITPPQFDALLVLDSNEGITMGELCQRMHLACSTATDLIDRMERSGLLERVRDPHDRRVIRLKVRPRGQEVLNAVMDARRRYLAGVLRRLDDQELEDLARRLRQVYGLMAGEMASG